MDVFIDETALDEEFKEILAGADDVLIAKIIIAIQEQLEAPH